MPTFLEKIFERIGYISKEKAAPPYVSSSGVSDPFIIWARTKKISPDKALAVYAGVAYACIKAIAEEIGNMEYRLMRTGADSNDEEIYEHDLIDLLSGVNDYQTGFELKYATAIHLESVGNAYWHLEGVNNETDKPTAIHIMNPARVRVVVNRDVFPTRIEKYQYRLSGKIYTFEPHQIIHFKDPDPNDSFEGVGTVQSIIQWIDADNFAMEFNRRFFLNGARLGGFLESESAYTPEQLDYLRKQFENIYKGVENAYKVAALPKGGKFSPSTEGQKDMDFATLMDKMRDRILAGFRVPRTVLGITDDVNRANAEATNYVFALRTIKPKMELIVSYLNERLLPRYGDDLYLDFVDPVPENREQNVTEMQAAVGSAPVMSTNEARERYFGLEPVERGDEVARPFTFSTLSSAGKLKPREMARPAQKNGKRRPVTRFSRNAKMRKGVAEAITARLKDELKSIAATIEEVKTKQKNITALSDSEYELLWKGFVTRVTPYEKRQAEAVRELNAKQKTTVLGNLANAVKSAKAVDTADLFNKEEWIAALVDLSTPILTGLMQAEGKEAAALLGVQDLEILTPEVRAALERAIGLMADSYNETTLDLLKSKLEEGIKEGLSLDELADKVAEIYEFSDDVRAEQVARTETFRVANEATHEAWKQTGVVKTVKWYTAADERVCPYCDPMHGKVVSIDENFFDKGDVVTGSDDSPEHPSKLPIDYDDVESPPLHVSCRCYIRPEEISIE